MSVFFTRRGEVHLVKKASDYSVGESVFLKVNGSPTEFLVVHQGLPSSLYDSSCDGTWLLMKDSYVDIQWDSSNNDYANSDMHSYLNNDFFALLDSITQSIIRQVKIPYQNGTGSGGSIASGTNGLSTKVFLLGGYEVGWTTSTSSYLPIDGAKLDYFSDNASRIAYHDGTAKSWWTRSANKNGSTGGYHVKTTGTYTSLNVTSTNASVMTRPALIVPYDTKFDQETNMIRG